MQLTPTKATAKLNKVIVVENIYRQISGSNAKWIFHSNLRTTNSDEQSYSRDITVGQDLQQLDVGWLENNVAELHLVNNIPKSNVVLSEEEIQQNNKKIIEVYIDTLVAVPGIARYVRISTIPLGCSIRFYPDNPYNIFVKCQTSTAQMSINVFPK